MAQSARSRWRHSERQRRPRRCEDERHAGWRAGIIPARHPGRPPHCRGRRAYVATPSRRRSGSSVRSLNRAAVDSRHGATRTAADPHLEVTGLCVQFEGVKAVDLVDVKLQKGELFGLIGPNGAGKTTLVNALTGFQRPTAGTIRLAGEDITRWSPERRARRGLVRTFQAVRLFSGLTVHENVTVVAAATGMNGRAASRFAASLLAILIARAMAWTTL